ncbi:hypothetical protein KAX02_05610 [candidate division WOR-3 bacterium]|nr:hypothetical protein [candidate division WOR-3 bacterium]
MALNIEEILAYLNNYFVYAHAPSIFIDCDATAKTISLADTDYTWDDYALDPKVDQYIRVEGSKLNDGVYKVTAVDTTSITVDATLIDEESDEDLDHVTIYELAIPQTLLSLVTEMIAWSGTNNVKSEKLGPHSVTYDKPVTVFTSFESRLKRWRKVGFR